MALLTLAAVHLSGASANRACLHRLKLLFLLDEGICHALICDVGFTYTYGIDSLVTTPPLVKRDFVRTMKTCAIPWHAACDRAAAKPLGSWLLQITAGLN